MELVLWLQETAGWLTPAMRAVTHLGDEEFYLLVFPLLYWCVSPVLGVRLGVVLLCSSALGGALKVALATPRPYWVDGAVVAGVLEESFGVPSGHAQNAVPFWGVLAHHVGRRWAWAAAGLLAVVLGISRVHLGVHFPTDVLAGWAVGLALLVVFLRLEPPATAWLRTRSPLALASVSLGAGLVLLGVGALALLAQSGSTLPESWTEAASAAGQEEFAPLSLAGVATPAGALAGLGAGLALLRVTGGFAVTGAAWRRLLRYPVGLVGVAVLWLGLGALAPETGDLLALAARFLRYAIVGAWISGLAPLLFVRLRLAAPDPGARQPV